MTDATPWLALLHQLPAKPPYLRVKIWRRLQSIGAVPLKNAVHVLPHSQESATAFGSLMAEIVDNGGEATLIEARLRSEEHTSELQSLMRISYAVFCLKKKKNKQLSNTQT